jgi:hypothetical protein
VRQFIFFVIANQAARSFQLKSRAAISDDQHSDTKFSAGDQYESSAEESELDEDPAQVHATPPFQLFFIPDFQMDVFWSHPEKIFLKFGQTVTEMVDSAYGKELYKPLLRELAKKIRTTPELHLIKKEWGIQQILFQLAGYFLFPLPPRLLRCPGINRIAQL